jgi:hypothetical protein
MARKILKWRCRFAKCGFEGNWIYADDVRAKRSMICANCGVGSAPKEPIDASKSWLPCIPLTGLNLRLPNGIPGEGYTDGAGKTLALDDYIKKYNVNPEIFYYFSHPSYKRPEDLIPLPIPKDAQVTEDTPTPPEELTPADKKVLAAQKKVDEFRDKKEITEMDYIKKLRYLEKLRDWRNDNLITDEDLEAQISRALTTNSK